MALQTDQSEEDNSKALWYLGIDFGTTGVSAVLLNYATGQHYPIYWQNELQSLKDQLVRSRSGEVMFRLPAITYSGPAATQLFVEPPATSVVVGSLASTLLKEPGIGLQNFKPYLQMGIPYYCPQRHEWEPILQLPGQQLVSLYWVRRSVQAILATLTPPSTLPNSVIKVGAVGLESETLGAALGQLEGVILGCPIDGGDTYQVNLREAVLEAQLVQDVKQILFLEDAIASILARFPKPNDLKQNCVGVRKPETISESGEESSNLGLSPSPWRGLTLAINIGATTTELALVDLPNNLQRLTHSHFTLQSWSYAGHTIDQDIFWQLLYPQMSKEQCQRLSLNRDLELPLPGQPDQPKRDRASFILQSSPFGQALLKASGYLKIILQHKPEFTLKLGDDHWTLKQKDIEAKVIVPFIKQLNHQLNALLSQAGRSEQSITQVVCTGGSTAFPIINQWLQHKLPNASVIQETDLPQESWVAAGLASLPLYPQVLNRHQQQYSDYFLLLELLHIFPHTAGEFVLNTYSLKEIMQQLERRGLNTSTCYERLVNLLEGYLPPGLIPSIDYGEWLSQASQQNPHYSRLTKPRLFFVEGGLYRPNPQQQQHLRQYLELVLSSMSQKFKEPLIVKIGEKS